VNTTADYLALPWTVYGRAVAEDGGYYLITVGELPGLSVVAATRAEAEAAFPEVLRDYLEACLESGHVPPTPAVALQGT
jgi:predicted RNase H-like HicB family nuclease